MVFQIFDVTADGGLRQVHGLPGHGKALKLDNFAKYIKLPEIHQVVRLSAKRSIQVIRYLCKENEDFNLFIIKYQILITNND